MSPERKRLPADVAGQLDAARNALLDITNGAADRTDAVLHAVDAALRLAWAAADTEASSEGDSRGSASFADIIRTRVYETRFEAGWTQAELAEAMEPYTGWSRQTVAEIEGRNRRVSLEELVFLSALFAEPVISFLLPSDHTRLDLDTTQIPPSVLAELLIGEGGTTGSGGSAWNAAGRVATEPRRRPAPDLWKNRSTARRHTARTESELETRTKRKRTT